MSPEMERRSEKLVVLGLAAKEKMNTINVDMCTKIVTEVNGVAEKRNVNVLVPEGEKNQDINVTDGVNLVEVCNGDETEEPSGSSSSFNDTTVSAGDDRVGLSDDEVISEFHGVQAAWDYPGFKEAFRSRKKKVTSHWRNFIRPIMWRCKWAELQMRKFQIQASIYCKLLEEFDQEKQAQKENFSAESQCSKTELLPRQMKRRKIMIRRKRKRVEDTTDAAVYMLQHNLFGYCENKRASTDFAQLNSGYTISAIPGVRNCDINILNNDEALVYIDDEETFLERILAKIDSIESSVCSLTTRVDNVMSENHDSDKMRQLTTPSDSDASTSPDPTAPSTDDDNVFTTNPSTTTQSAFDHHVGEANMPLIPVSASLPDAPQGADHPIVAYKSDNAEDMTQLNEHPIAENKLRVYKRAKKRKTLSEKQSNISSNAPLITQNEKSSVFLASRFTALQNNQKKRGKRKRSNSVKKAFGES